ncbi:hypothetical protein KC19_VG240900 [Ceratodon purpureus]|uniref:Nucleotidyl transferase domain-containing protein n=1 Tax=Ceratodon purpureus TaxID=3225 RepID=A0A8T0HTR0_CERPU|nr:hypothetical protein KC19_VG240900 [Ceratodon purpureus]
MMPGLIEQAPKKVSKVPQELVNMTMVFSIILGVGAGTRLNPLTLKRVKPASKHKDSGVGVTVSCVPMDDSRASD